MAEIAVRESKDRVRAALMSSGFEFPQQRITVSLGPAEMKKSGGRFDLAIALGILAAKRQFPKSALDGVEFYGELALSGELKPVAAILPAVLRAQALGRKVIVPCGNRSEASMGCDQVYPAASLADVTAHLAAKQPIAVADPVALGSVDSHCPISVMCAVSNRPKERSRSLPPAGTTCCLSVRPAPAKACWRGACRAFCRL